LTCGPYSLGDPRQVQFRVSVTGEWSNGAVLGFDGGWPQRNTCYPSVCIGKRDAIIRITLRSTRSSCSAAMKEGDSARCETAHTGKPFGSASTKSLVRRNRLTHSYQAESVGADPWNERASRAEKILRRVGKSRASPERRDLSWSLQHWVRYIDGILTPLGHLPAAQSRVGCRANLSGPPGRGVVLH
jgi:hypothetical protein